MFEKVFKSINDFFDPKYVDTTPIPKQENHPDELKQKVKKTILESGMFEHAKNYEKTGWSSFIIKEKTRKNWYLRMITARLKWISKDLSRILEN